jgi:arylsulfatase A-like enzyme
MRSILTIQKKFRNNLGMKQKKLWEIPLILMCLFIYFTSSCNQIKPRLHKLKSGELFRFIDCLKTENVVHTPFKNIIKNFELINEDLTKKLVYLNQLSTRSQKVWAATTQRSILGYDENKKPYEMEVFLNKEKLDFLEESDKDSIKWKWIQADRDIEIQNDDKYVKGFKCLILDEENAFSFETILPDDDIELEIKARRNWHPVNLEIYFDNKFIEKKRIRRLPRIYNLKQRSSLKNYRITLKATLSKRLKVKKKPVPPRLLIYWIKIRTRKDVILFFIPPKYKKNFENSRLRTQYFSDYKDSGKKNKYLGLYKMKHTDTLSKFDQAENPENIKKKIALERIWLNTLMSPPKSQFEFDINIPPKSLLEFGIGASQQENTDVFPPVKFKILVGDKKIRKVLYEKIFHLQPGDERNQLIFEKINMSAFANRNIKLTFLTERLSRIDNDSSEDNVFSFWFNPIIYQPSPEKLKIILVSIDTLRADHLGSYGYSRHTSPNLDELAKDSVLFKNVYAQSPWTLPSHVSILYSLNSASHQVYFKDQKIDDSLPSVSSYLRKSGFLTYAFTGGGFVSGIYGFSKGYDWYDEPVKGKHGQLRPDESCELFKYTADWIKKNKDKQFFLFLHTFQTHGPYDCPPPWNEAFLDKTAKWKRFALRIYLEKMGYSHPFKPEEIRNIMGLYDGEIKYTDEALIKPLISFLKELEIYDHTLLIITSDHGEEFADHGGWEHGHALYDELIRVPLIIKFPGSQFKGKRINTICRTIDIMPTLLEFTSTEFKKNQLDGKSLRDLILEKERNDRIFISDLAHKNLLDPCPAMMATNDNKLKLILDKASKGTKGLELYDLSKDPNETKNILQKELKSARALLEFINDYYSEKFRIQRKIEKVYLDKELKEKLKALGYIK